MLMFASDIHGSLSAMEQMLARFTASRAQWLLLLGDILNHGPRNPLPEGYDPAAVAKCLNAFAHKIIAVRGNCDSEVDQMLLDFPVMAPWQQIPLCDTRLFITHGHLYSPEQLPPLSRGDVFIFGHTHVPQAVLRDGLYLFNPGSVTLPKGGFMASYGMFDEEVLSVCRLDNNEVIAQVAINS